MSGPRAPGPEGGPGVLSVVATPIGNLGDISDRARTVLAAAHLILAEDTRRTRVMLQHYGIDRPVERFDAHTEHDRTAAVVARIAAGARVALTSDAGTPVLSDPGLPLVRAAHAAGLRVETVPGPFAAAAALAAAGLPATEVLFVGFPPERPTRRQAAFARWAASGATVVMYVAPHDAARLARAAADAFGEREAVLARELTKVYESYRRGTPAQIAAACEAAPPKGECVLMIGPPADEAPAAVDLAAEAAGLTTERPDEPTRALAEILVQRFGVPKKAAYDAVVLARRA